MEQLQASGASFLALAYTMHTKRAIPQHPGRPHHSAHPQSGCRRLSDDVGTTRRRSAFGCSNLIVSWCLTFNRQATVVLGSWQSHMNYKYTTILSKARHCGAPPSTQFRDIDVFGIAHSRNNMTFPLDLWLFVHGRSPERSKLRSMESRWLCDRYHAVSPRFHVIFVPLRLSDF